MNNVEIKDEKNKLIFYFTLHFIFCNFFSSDQPSLIQVTKDLVIDIFDPSSKPSYFTFSAKFILKINETTFSEKKNENFFEMFEFQFNVNNKK